MYQRNGSEPYCSMAANGSDGIAETFGHFVAVLVQHQAAQIRRPYTLRYRTPSDAMACKVKNHPRVWSTPSAMKSAG
ncbi:MAG: hypothetical protein ACLRS8_18025 [Parabacteroides merdae]